MIPGGSRRADGGGDCQICSAGATLLRRMSLLAGEALREEVRSQLLVALIIGLRHDPITVCGTCHDKLEAVSGAADAALKRMRGLQ